MGHRAAKLTILAAAAALAVACPLLTAPAPGAGPDPQRRARAAPRRKPAASPQRAREAKFSHRAPAHRISCDACHAFPSANWKEARAGDDAFPDVVDYPGHASCLGCHRRQFFARERPAPRICSVCHVAVTPRYTARHPFPNPPDAFRRSKKGEGFASAFRVRFPHDKHLELFARAAPGGARALLVAFRQGAVASEVCANCHTTYRPQGDSDDEYAAGPPPAPGDGFRLKKGTFETSPEGHATCFTCHSAESEVKPAPSDCAACHALEDGAAPARVDFDPAAAAGVADPVALEAWRRRDSSATFRHEGGLHPEVACAACHDVASAGGAARVRIQSCGGGETGCHITPTADDGGALNFEVERRRADPAFRCAKCHLAFAAAPVPASHTDALARARAE